MGVTDRVSRHLVTKFAEEEVSGDEEEFMSSREHITCVYNDNYYYTL